jgi:hypothetical protein
VGERDIYYLTPEETKNWIVSIPPGHYVMLGDNTQDSADSRLWEAQTYTLRPEGEPIRLRGNLRDRENPLFPELADGTPAVRFKDEWGEVHWFAQSATAGQTLRGQPAPLVPRELIHGRAVAVFWPLDPFRKLWRLGWLH